MGQTSVKIRKHSGELVPFDARKLKSSMERSGASEQVIQDIVSDMEKSLYDGMTTKEIYKKAFAMLRKRSAHVAGRYKLKKAIMELGPSGFPFEDFIAAILRYQGFETQTRVLVKGHCVQHEVDVVATRTHQKFMVECKYHSAQGRHCDVKIPLYIQSRFKDVERQWKKSPDHENPFHQGWIFTNTRFTADAIQYGNCAGLVLVGWDYPKSGSLRERIDISGLHPITCLSSLTNHEKQLLLSQGVVLCKDLCESAEKLSDMGIGDKRVKRVMEESHALCD